VTAALLHVFNHAMFKSLLFCGAGSLLVATGRALWRSSAGLFIDACDGVYRVDRRCGDFRTAAAQRVCFGMASVPDDPIESSFSAWSLKLLALRLGAARAHSGHRGGCFVRYFGTIFLGRPRSVEAKQAYEVTDTRSPPWDVAALCVISGIVPVLLRSCPAGR